MSLFAKGDPWKNVKEKYSPAVVQIETEVPRAFSQTQFGTYSASGFIVDKVRGIIVTNKHVITSAPIRAKARFLRNEEVDLVPVFRDPVHDYGFFTFDPSKVKDTPLVDIKMNPDGAKPQEKVLIMGNAAGEKLTYVESTIGRVDRNYEESLDCNTFYISATDITVGGSSGGPMMNTKGQAVGIVTCGEDETNSSFYLPLHRIKRALDLWKSGKPITRGTLQVAFFYKSYTDIERRGVSESIIKEQKQRFPGGDGMLVVSKNIPQGPGNVAGIENGDVLYKINGKLVPEFISLAEVLDSSIGKKLTIEVFRGGEKVQLAPTVQNLEEISPSEMIEISQSVVSSIDYLIAMECNLPIEGVIISQAGYMFKRSDIDAFNVILEINNEKIENLADFERVMKLYPSSTLVKAKFFHILAPVQKRIAELVIDKRWFPFRYGKRNDTTGKWDYRDCEPQTKVARILVNKFEVQDSGEASTETRTLRQLAGAVVTVFFDSAIFVGDSNSHPIPSISTYDGFCIGTVVDRSLGLIVCDRSIVASTLGDVFIDFGSALKIAGEVIFIDPIFGFSVVQYDPAVAEKDVLTEIQELRISDQRAAVGDTLQFIGAQGNQRVISGKGEIVSSDFIAFRPPFNFEILQINGRPSCGAYFDKDDQEIRAFGLNLTYNLPAYYIKPAIDRIQAALNGGGVPPSSISTIPINLSATLLSKARKVLSLDDKWAQRLKETSDGFSNSLLTVRRRMVKTPAYEVFEDNDVILAVNDEAVTKLSAFYDATGNREEVDVTVLRAGEVVPLKGIKSTNFSTTGTNRVLICAGMILHEPHPFIYYMTEPSKVQFGGAYVATLYNGSPSMVSDSKVEDPTEKAGTLLFALNNQPLGDNSLDKFLELVTKVKHNEWITISTMDYTTGEVKQFSLRLDLEFWPTTSYERDDANGWHYEIVEHAK